MSGQISFGLDSLSPFVRGPADIECTRMTLLCRDFEPPLAEGRGVFQVVSEREFHFRMVGQPVDLAHSLTALNRLEADPYDGLNRLRLEMTDATGRQWSGGWTIPEINTDEPEWIFTGRSDGLSTVAPRAGRIAAGAEARYIIPRNHSASIVLRRFVRTAAGDGSTQPLRTIEVLGHPVSFRFDDESNVLAISAPHSAELPAHATENWLGEPLRILFGQLVFPRLVERRLGDGNAMLWVRRSPSWTRDSDWTALWGGEQRFTDDEQFFTLYANLLTLIARTGDWESHTVTSFYEEVIQAARGSRWVWALTLASSIEGLVRILSPRGALRPDADQAAIDAMLAHLHVFEGSARLKSRAIDVIRRADEMSPARALRDLAATGVGASAQISSWESVRHRVMHGELVSPYSSAEDDRIIVDLAELLKALTVEAARRAAATSPD